MKKFSILLVNLSLVLIGHLRGQSLEVTAKGTGNTTGHIANLLVSNKGQSPVNILQQSVFIPSDGQYQPYVAVIPPTTIPPGTTTIPVNGYCVDPHTPPVPSNNPMITPDSWVPVGDPNATIPEGSVNIITTPTVPSFKPEDIPGITTSPGYTPVAPDPEADIIITWPGTDIPVGGTFNPAKDPKTFAPVIVKAFDEVGKATEVIQSGGVLKTPFSPDKEKEFQADVQQVLWIYTAVLSGSEYGKDDFAGKVYDQYASTTGKPIASLPEEQKKEMDAGIDQFWNVFTAVGIEAKVLRKPENDLEGMDDPVLIANIGTKIIIVDELSQAERYKQEMKNCFFSRLEYSVFVEHIYTRGSGNKKKNSIDTYRPNEKNEVEIKIQKDDTLFISLHDLKCQCPCWTEKDKDGIVSGPLCDCTITGVSQHSFNDRAFTDLMEADLDKLVIDSLKKEIAAQLKKLQDAGGKKSEIDKLQKQLDDEKKLRKENKARIEELKKNLNGPWRLANQNTQTSFKVKAGFTGEVEFVFSVDGKCTGADPCKSSEWSREVKVKVNVPR